jgi:hypothetical protein
MSTSDPSSQGNALGGIGRSDTYQSRSSFAEDQTNGIQDADGTTTVESVPTDTRRWINQLQGILQDPIALQEVGVSF